MGWSQANRRAGAGLLLASALALSAWCVRRAARRAEQKFPPVGKFIHVDGLRLHYLEQGSGPTVLLLHGNGSQATDFAGAGLLDQLAPRYRVIAIDRPGFGYSERPRGHRWTPDAQADLLQKACAALGIQEAIVLGHSFGTLVALALALRHPAFVRGLVLVSGYYFATPRVDAWLLSPPAIPVIGDIMRYTISPLIGKLMMRPLLRRIFSPGAIDCHFVRAVPPPMMLRPWQLKASAEESAFMVPSAAALSRHYTEIVGPVEILAGADDKLVAQKKQSVRLREAIPHSRLHLIPGAGHMLHYDRPETVCEAVDRIAASPGGA